MIGTNHGRESLLKNPTKGDEPVAVLLQGSPPRQTTSETQCPKPLNPLFVPSVRCTVALLMALVGEPGNAGGLAHQPPELAFGR